MSPEQAAGRPYNHKVDIYALGLVFLELVCCFSTEMEKIEVSSCCCIALVLFMAGSCQL